MAAPAFGFSVGDFIAALELVRTVIDALRESSKSGASFRGLLSELYTLETALLEVKRLDPDEFGTAKIASLRQAASQCQTTIDGFWKKAQKYQPHLQHGGTGLKVKDSWYKIKWAVCKESDLEKFRAEIRGHTSSLNILLSTLQMETMSLERGTADSRHNNLARMIQDLTFSAMEKLTAITSGLASTVPRGKELLEASAQIIQTNLRIFQIVHDIQLFILRIPGQVQRQQPVYLIDALNKESPFHLEFVRSPEALLAVLKINLRETGCGPRMIDRKEFVIEESTTQKKIDFTTSWDSCFFPGQRVVMSMVFKGEGQDKTTCPSCGTEHEQATDVEITCTNCGSIFRRIKKIDIDDVSDQDFRDESSSSKRFDGNDELQSLGYRPAWPRKRKRQEHDLVNEVRKFRRIRMIDLPGPTVVEHDPLLDADQFLPAEALETGFWQLNDWTKRTISKPKLKPLDGPNHLPPFGNPVDIERARFAMADDFVAWLFNEGSFAKSSGTSPSKKGSLQFICNPPDLNDLT